MLFIMFGEGEESKTISCAKLKIFHLLENIALHITYRFSQKYGITC